MTGFGRASVETELGAITIEVKSVNHRFLKVAVRVPEAMSQLESALEARIKKVMERGSVFCSVSFDRRARPVRYDLNIQVLDQFHQQLSEWAAAKGQPEPNLADMLGMAGVVSEESNRQELSEDDHAAILGSMDSALAGLNDMRDAEGNTLAEDLSSRVDVVAERTKQAQNRAPTVIQEYRGKLLARIGALLDGTDVKMEDTDVAREVAYFADRCDITEEITRLVHHCEQFQETLKKSGGVGRKLDFIAQEMLRETNTIASKANDVELSSLAVEMKTELEKIKEQIQNLE